MGERLLNFKKDESLRIFGNKNTMNTNFESYVDYFLVFLINAICWRYFSGRLWWESENCVTRSFYRIDLTETNSSFFPWSNFPNFSLVYFSNKKYIFVLVFFKLADYIREGILLFIHELKPNEIDWIFLQISIMTIWKNQFCIVWKIMCTNKGYLRHP